MLENILVCKELCVEILTEDVNCCRNDVAI